MLVVRDLQMKRLEREQKETLERKQKERLEREQKERLKDVTEFLAANKDSVIQACPKQRRDILAKRKRAREERNIIAKSLEGQSLDKEELSKITWILELKKGEPLDATDLSSARGRINFLSEQYAEIAAVAEMVKRGAEPILNHEVKDLGKTGLPGHFDQVWKKVKDGKVIYYVTEAKGGDTIHYSERKYNGKKVKQGEKDYFFAICDEMSGRSEHERTVADDLRNAFHDGRVEYLQAHAPTSSEKVTISEFPASRESREGNKRSHPDARSPFR